MISSQSYLIARIQIILWNYYQIPESLSDDLFTSRHAILHLNRQFLSTNIGSASFHEDLEALLKLTLSLRCFRSVSGQSR